MERIKTLEEASKYLLSTGHPFSTGSYTKYESGFNEETGMTYDVRPCWQFLKVSVGMNDHFGSGEGERGLAVKMLYSLMNAIEFTSISTSSENGRSWVILELRELTSKG